VMNGSNGTPSSSRAIVETKQQVWEEGVVERCTRE
jgi:hypothetical protein